ncbi:MAG: hypothetical protein EZS28_048380, partial [Streblomastix strix]
MLDVIKRLLSCEKESILANATELLQRFIYPFIVEYEEGKPNPLLKDMENDGSISKLIEIFKDDQYRNKDINSQLAYSIGRLFKAVPLPTEFGLIIVKYLKDLTVGKDQFFQLNSLDALMFLAECE